MRFLTPQEQVQEEDVPWDYAQVLQTLASQVSGTTLALALSPSPSPSSSP